MSDGVIDSPRCSFRKSHGMRAALLVFMTSCCCLPWTNAMAKDAGTVLVTVNQSPITEGDLQFALFLRRHQDDESPELRKKVLEQLVERRLMTDFLAQRKAIPDDKEIAAQVERVHAIIRKAGSEPADVLKKLQLTDERLKSEVALPLAWTIHSRRIISDTQVQAYWTAHREELDGTQLRASHILRKIDPKDPEASAREAIAALEKTREEILAKSITFAEAARQSDAPSRESGGDVGFFPARGKMPAAFCEAAFALKEGEVSRPVRTPFGVHLITITDRRPGDLSLEDARGEVIQRVQRQQWNDIALELKKSAKIEWRPMVD